MATRWTPRHEAGRPALRQSAAKLRPEAGQVGRAWGGGVSERRGLRGVGPGRCEGGWPGRPFRSSHQPLWAFPADTAGDRKYSWPAVRSRNKSFLQRPEQDLGLRVLASALPLNLGHTALLCPGPGLAPPAQEGRGGLRGGRQTRPNLTLPLGGAFLGKSLELPAVSVVNPRPGTRDSSSTCWLLLQGPQLAGPFLWTCGLPRRGLRAQLPPTDTAAAGTRAGGSVAQEGPAPGRWRPSWG